MIKKIIIAIVVVVLLILAIIGIKGLFTPVRYGDNSTISGGLNVLLSNPTDTLSVGTSSPKFVISAGAGSVYTGGGIVFGGGVFATSSAASATLLPSNIVSSSSVSSNLISVNPTVGNVTITLPASTSLPSTYLSNVGDEDELFIYNATTTAGITVTIAGNTGMLLRKATTTAAILPGGSAIINLVRLPTSDITAIFDNNI